MTTDDEIEWPREIWMREREEHDQGVVTAVLSEHATVARWEGDHDRDAAFHRYVDADIYDSAERYWRDRIEALTAEVARLRGEVEHADDSFDRLVSDGRARGQKAMKRYPQPNYVITKLAEEAGEVVKDAVHCAEGRGEYSDVRDEMVDVIAMIYRLWVEGDEVHGLRPVGVSLAPTGEAEG